MRLSLRLVVALLGGAGVATCSESPTNARPQPFRLGLAPRFSPTAAAIFRSLTAFEVTIDNVHVVVRATSANEEPGAVLKDTTVAFPATANEISIEIELAIPKAEQSVVATVELREGATSYFHGMQAFVARQGETAGGSAAMEMTYAGPGASATSVSIAPNPATLAPAASFQFAARALDAMEKSVDDLPLTWSTSDATTASVSATGLVTTATKPGTTTLTVTGLNGLSDHIELHVQPVAQLVVASGADQTGTVGAALSRAFEVAALDANNNSVGGVTIDFSTAGGGASVSPATTTTGADGLARTTITLGPNVGTYTFVATVAGAPSAVARVTETASAPLPSSLSIAGGNQQTDSVGATLASPLTVKVTDSLGNVIIGQPVLFQVATGRPLLSPGVGQPPAASLTAITGSGGIAASTMIADTLAGPVRVTAMLLGTAVAPVTFTVTVKPGSAARLVLLQQPSTSAQATLPLGEQPRIGVADRFGNAVSRAGLAIDVSVSCTVCARMTPQRARRALDRLSAVPAPPNAARLAAQTAPAQTRSIADTLARGLAGTIEVMTDASGVATFTDLALNELVGLWALQFFTAAEPLSAVLSDAIQLSAGPAASLIAWSVTDTTFIGFAGDTLFPSIQVIDKVGNGIAGVSVNWDVADTLSTIVGQRSMSTKTETNGVAAPGPWVTAAGAASFNIRVTATSGLKLENSPLSLWAIVQPPLGRLVPPLPNGSGGPY